MPWEVLLIYSIVNIDKIMNIYSPQGGVWGVCGIKTKNKITYWLQEMNWPEW